MKKVLAAAALVLATGSLSSCGGPPEDASKSEFCGAFQDFAKKISTIDGSSSGDDAKAISALKDFRSKMLDIGTPANISDSARNGFLKTMDQIDGLKDSSKIDDLSKLQDQLSSQEKKDSEAFDKYLNDECGDMMGGS